MYRLLLPVFLFLIVLPAAAQETEFGYATVQAALDALKARSDVAIFEKDGWTIIEDDAADTLWSFTPPTHPAHPSAVKRTVVKDGDDVLIDTKGLCQAEKPACDALMAAFMDQNERIGRSVAPGGTRTGDQEKGGRL